jgi:ribonucleoside-triphosphate reductase
MPTVRKTAQTIEEFILDKIVQSLVVQTGISAETATKVAAYVENFIVQSNITWLSGPLIREICCVALAQMGLHDARRRYTRVGMPAYDYEQLLLQGYKENSNQYKNPESIHAWAADRVAAEYTLLRILPERLARFHFEGWGQIHKLKYFPLRPFCAGWDPRMIIYCGLPPGGSLHSAASGAAKHPLVATLHLAKWMGIIQGSFQGGQGYDHFTAFMAPLLEGFKEDKEFDQIAQCFIFETNQIFAARGAQVPFTSMHCSPEIPKDIAKLPAIRLGGKVSDRITYDDYQDECKRLFDAICRVEMKGDREGKLFNFPKHEIEVRKEWLKKHEDSYLLVHQEAAKMGTPYFILYPDWMPSDAHCQCCRIIFTKDGLKRYCIDEKKLQWEHSYINIGSLQSVSLNFPRLAYVANGDDDLLYENLNEQLEIARDILLLKKSITERTYKEDPLLNKMIPFPRGDDQPIFDLDRYSLTVGFVGLNEMLKAHLGLELHESRAAQDFGKKFLKRMMDRLEEFTVENRYNFTAWEQPAESASNRFAMIDRQMFGDRVIANGVGNGIYYTNSDHVRYDAKAPLYDVIDIQAQFHPIVKGGVITHVWMGEAFPDARGLFTFTKQIMEGPTAYMAYTKDFTQCLDCKKFISGRREICSHCKSTNLEWWSRVTGYYARVTRFSAGKRQEWDDRDLKSI